MRGPPKLSLPNAMKRLVQIVLIIIVGLVTAGYLAFRASLPELDGQLTAEGLIKAVSIERDELGVPTVHGENRTDVAWATGFLHAQDRFFQMDLLRRSTAGELSELIGPAALDVDRDRRLHRMRQRASVIWTRLTHAEQELIRAYTSGVNAGLGRLKLRPFEYLILRSTPVAWREVDTILVSFAFFFELNDYEAYRESTFARLQDELPPAMHAFITAAGSEWDAPMVGDAFVVPPVPGPSVCDLRGMSAPAMRSPDQWPPVLVEQPMAGSNGWAVGGGRSATGKAMVANDMHLDLRVPNIWYRMRLVVIGSSVSQLDVTGVTAPGTPFVVAGSNGSVAWGFTNSYGDWIDLVLLELNPDDPDQYRTPDGYQDFDEYIEEIHVRGTDSVRHTVQYTIWGPVIGTDHNGRKQALRWLAHEPEAVNVRIVQLEQARDVRDAIQIGQAIGAPPQNLMVADSHGEIAWTIMGRIPMRQGFDPQVPGYWSDDGIGWVGWVPQSDYPAIINPDRGYIWTANSRVVDGEMLERIGNGGYILGARSRQIRDGLAALSKATINDMLSIQLDDRAILHERWRDQLVRTLPADKSRPRLSALRDIVSRWDGHARVDSIGYRLVREYRLIVRERVFSSLFLGCGEIDEPIQLRKQFQTEGPLWRMITERPPHLIPLGFESWEEALMTAATEAVDRCEDGQIETCTWGAQNHVRITHPLAGSLPFLATWLDINDGPLPGGDYTPRLQQGVHAASERFAVSPGDEENGYFHMPGGQSGHPLSPFYRAGHEAWARGERLPFLPGDPVFRLSIEPAD
jgi:penicillin amidase